MNYILTKIRRMINVNENYKYDCIRICSIYLVIGLFWMISLEVITYKISNPKGILATIHAYKGEVFVLITTIILYMLINNLLRKVYSMEQKLNESYEELSASNEELQAYVNQLTASEEEIRYQYEQIAKNEEEIRKSEQRNRAIIKAIPDLLFVIDRNNVFVDCATSDLSRLFLPPEVFIGKNIKDVMPPEISNIAIEKIKLVLEHGELEKFEYVLEEQYFELRIVKNNENEVLAISRDITLERKNEQELKVSENRYRTLVNEMQQGLAVYETTLEGEDVRKYKLVTINESYKKLMGIACENPIGKTIDELINKLTDEYYAKLQYVADTGKPIYYENYVEFNGFYHEVTAFKPHKYQLAVIVNNITERKKFQNELEHLSYHDKLTGLYNRRFFEKELLRIDNEENLPLGVIMADVNGLKLVNDSFGHTVGDELIRKVARVLELGCREGDVVSRIAGDEFVIFLPNTTSEEVEKIIENIKQLALKEKVESIDISVSFGFETKVNKEENINEIYKKAENNMYKKKLFESPSMRGKTISTIISTLNEKNKREEEHSHRVSKLCEAMGYALKLSQDATDELKTVGLLHDIGKIAIEEYILNKPATLTKEEFEEIKRHPEIGYRILSTVNEMSEMAEYVLAHHERWNGTGYPKKLEGTEIPMQSRIIAIADTYDAMISERSYRKALPEEVAIEELKVNAGIQFDAELVKIFIEKVLNK